MRNVDPRFWLEDSTASPQIFQFRQALTVAEQLGTNRLIIATYTPPKSSLLVVKAVSVFAQQRVNVGLDTETIQMIDPAQADGFFNFEFLIANKPAFFSQLNMNQMATNGNQVASEVNQVNGLTFLSSNPLSDVQRAWFNPLFTFIVPPSATLTMTFGLLPLSPTNPLAADGQYSIGGAATVTKRVDYAGVVLAGQFMPKEYYDAVRSEATRTPGL